MLDDAAGFFDQIEKDSANDPKLREEGIVFRREDAPLGPGKTEPRSFAYLERRSGEKMVDTKKRLEDRDQIAFRYCDPEGRATSSANPNGSNDNIAGVFNDAKNVLGLMPHPEDAVEPIHGSLDGKPLFDGIVRALS